LFLQTDTVPPATTKGAELKLITNESIEAEQIPFPVDVK
jgi:hypothetical protein